MTSSRNFFDLERRRSRWSPAPAAASASTSRARWRAPARTWSLTARNAKSCADLRRPRSSAGPRVVALELDVRDEPASDEMADAAQAAFGQIDILVNNAGCNVRKPAVDVTWDDWNLILDTNLRGTFFVAQAVAPRT